MGKGGTVALMSEIGRIWRRVGRRHVKGSGSTKVIICISPVRGGVGPFLTGVPAPRLLACSLGKKSLLTEKHFCVIPTVDWFYRLIRVDRVVPFLFLMHHLRDGLIYLLFCFSICILLEVS